MERAHELNTRNYDTQRRYGHVTQTWWARTQLVETAFETGRWDEALEHAEAVIAYVEAGNPLYTEAGSRIVRAAVTFARGGDIGAFDADIDRSLALVAEATDPQAKWIIVLRAAYLRLRAGDRVAAQQLLDESLETARATEDNTIHYPAALLAASLQLDPGEVAIPPLEVASAPLRGASAALLEGDLLGAADSLAEIGKVSDEADVRLQAGKQLLAEGHADEGKAQVERALVFHRGVRATRFVPEAEALLAETHRQSA
jgi:hypothetical protein